MLNKTLMHLNKPLHNNIIKIIDVFVLDFIFAYFHCIHEPRIVFKVLQLRSNVQAVVILF